MRLNYWENKKLLEMDNWFPIGKHVDFNLIYPPLGRVRGGINLPFQCLLWLKAHGAVFLTGT